VAKRVSPKASKGTNGTPVKRVRTKAVAKVQTPTEEDVRLRAYFLYIERGGVEGDGVNDWVRAEQELYFTYK
jgi:hypothetical protein